MILAFLLTIWATTANGQWKFVLDNPDEDVRWFLDTSRISFDDSRIWVWFLVDYKKLQVSNSGAYHSIESLQAINCVTLESSFFDYIYYADRGGRGKVIDSDSFGGAGSNIPKSDSISEALATVACEEFARTYKPKEIKSAGRRSLIQS
jgi:hypothetical protein